MTGLMVVRMSWVTYLRPLLQVVSLGSAAVLYIAFWPDIHAYISSSIDDQQSVLPALITLVPLVVVAGVVFKGIWRIALNRSVVVTIAPHGVQYRSGILPWKRHENHWRYEQIYQALYQNRPAFLGWLFRFGDLVIVGREGSTREYRFRGLHNPRRAQLLISSRTNG